MVSGQRGRADTLSSGSGLPDYVSERPRAWHLFRGARLTGTSTGRRWERERQEGAPGECGLPYSSCLEDEGTPRRVGAGGPRARLLRELGRSHVPEVADVLHQPGREG